MKIIIIFILLSLSYYSYSVKLHDRTTSKNNELISAYDDDNDGKVESKSDYCKTHNCLDCKLDSECPRDFICRNKGSSPLFCNRRPLFPGFTYYDAIATVFAFMVAILASVAGMGGGELLLPIFILCAGLLVHEAIPLCQFTSFGSSLINLIINLTREHPNGPGQSLIAFVPLQYFAPPLIVGNTIGIFLQVMSPNWFILAILSIILLYASYATTRQAFGMYAKRRQESLEEKQSLVRQVPSDPNSTHSPVNDSPVNYSVVSPSKYNDMFFPAHGLRDDSELDKTFLDLAARERNILLQQMISLLFLTTVVTATLIRGGHPSSPSIAGIYTCTKYFWIACALSAPALLLFMIYPTFRIKQDYAAKLKLDIHERAGEIQWTPTNMALYPIVFFVVGLVAGMAGIGGGMFNSPILLAIGMLPEVAVATSATGVFVTSFSASLNFYMLDHLLVDYAIWYFAIGVSGALIGMLVLQALFKKYNAIYIVGFIIAGLVIVGAILMLTLGVIILRKNIISGTNLTFKSFCHAVGSK